MKNIKKVFMLILFAAFTIIVSSDVVFANSDNIKDELTVYKFDGIDTIQNGISINLDETSQIITLDGTQTASSSRLSIDVLTQNELGYKLDHTKDYALYYEYVSGDTDKDTSALVAPIGIKFEPKTTYESKVTAGTYFLKGSGVLTTLTSEELLSLDTLDIVFASQTYENYKFKLSFFEISDTNEIQLFNHQDIEITEGTLTYQLVDGNRMILNGKAEADIDLSAYINTTIKDQDLYLVSVRVVSGTVIGTAEQLELLNLENSNDTGFGTNYWGDDKDFKLASEITTGENLKNLIATPSMNYVDSRTFTYTDYIVDYYVQNLTGDNNSDVVYSEEDLTLQINVTDANENELWDGDEAEIVDNLDNASYIYDNFDDILDAKLTATFEDGNQYDLTLIEKDEFENGSKALILSHDSYDLDDYIYIYIIFDEDNQYIEDYTLETSDEGRIDISEQTEFTLEITMQVESSDTSSGADTGSGAGIGGNINANDSTFLGLAWYYWLAAGAVVYLVFTKKGRKVIGLK